MEKIIELKNLTKNFDDQQVLKGINLDIHHNEFLTLLGPSGCGKSTLSKTILGLHDNYTGEVKVRDGVRPQMVDGIAEPDHAAQPDADSDKQRMTNGSF